MITGINHITFAVSDLERSIQFYKDLLGMTCVHEWPQGAYMVARNLWIAFNVTTEPITKRRDYTHVALQVDKEKYDIIVSRLIEAGIVPFQDNYSPGESFYFNDPDGYQLELHYNTLVDRLNAVQNIREAKMDEADLLAHITDVSEASWGFDEDYMTHFRAHYTVTSAYIQEHPVFCHIGENGVDGFYGLTVLTEEKAVLDYLYVIPEAMGRGIGRTLFRHMIAYLAEQGIKRVKWVTSPEANPFYAAMGARVVGETESIVVKGRIIPTYVYDLEVR